jgi:hypothetical protein
MEIKDKKSVYQLGRQLQEWLSCQVRCLVLQNKMLGRDGVLNMEEETRSKHCYQTLLYLWVSDLIKHNHYTLKGLSQQTGIPLDAVIHILGREGKEASFSFAMKILLLHKESFPEQYAEHETCEFCKNVVGKAGV